MLNENYRLKQRKREKKKKNESLQIFGLNEEKMNERTMQYWFGIEEFDVLVQE
jgi:lipid A disaccharide synthetase